MKKFKNWLRKKILRFLQEEVIIHTPINLDGKEIYEKYNRIANLHNG